MRPSLGKSCFAVLRSIAGLTQADLAKLVGISRPTVQAVELSKLALSRRLAERVCLHTGVSLGWLLANRYKVPPVCQRDPQEPYTRQTFEMTRAEISDPRTHPVDLQYKTVGSVYGRLGAMLLEAYRANKTVYFQHKLRLLVDDLEAEFPGAKDFEVSDEPKKAAADLWKRLQGAAQAKTQTK